MLSGKQARRTRVAAGLAIVLLGVVVVLTIASVNDDLRRLSVQIPLLLLAVAGAWYALTRTGARRVAGAAVVAVALIGVVGYEFVQDPSTFAVALGRVALLALAVLLGRWAVRRTWAAAEPPGTSDQTPTTWRPRYCPQVGQAMCGGVSAPQARFGQVTSVGTLAFHCERRERVLLRDIFLFGTATIYLLLITRRTRRRAGPSSGMCRC